MNYKQGHDQPATGIQLTFVLPLKVVNVPQYNQLASVIANGKGLPLQVPQEVIAVFCSPDVNLVLVVAHDFFVFRLLLSDRFVFDAIRIQQEENK